MKTRTLSDGRFVAVHRNDGLRKRPASARVARGRSARTRGISASSGEMCITVSRLDLALAVTSHRKTRRAAKPIRAPCRHS